MAFVLQTALVLVIAGSLLHSAADHARSHADGEEAVHLQYLNLLARLALADEDRGNLQTVIDETRRDPRIEAIVVVDAAGRVVGTSEPALLGRPFASLPPPALPGRHDITAVVEGPTRPLGTIVVRFTDTPVHGAMHGAIGRSLWVCIIGILTSALFALAAGHVLARRLDDLARAAGEVADGGHFRPTGTGGAAPEVAALTRSITSMVERLQQQTRDLQAAHDRLVVPTEAMAQGFALWDARDRLTICNTRCSQLLEVEAGAVRPGLDFARFAALTLPAPGQALDLARERSELRRAGRRVYDYRLAGGRVLEVDETATRDGGVVALYTDVTAARRAATEVRRQGERLKLVMTSVLDGVVLIDGKAQVIDLNPAAERMLNAPAGVVGDLCVRVVTEPSWRGWLAHPVVPLQVEARLLRGDGVTMPVDLTVVPAGPAEPDLFIASLRDASARQRAEAELRDAASRDRLTGLANRHATHAALARSITEAARERHQLAVLFVDLDGFKVVNDTHGHATGDAVLVEVAHRLESVVGDGGSVGRFGGDEFLILLPDVTKNYSPSRVADAVRRALREPFAIADLELVIGASVGIAVFPEHGTDEHDLLQAADTALYEAKRPGGDRWRWFSRSMLARNSHRVTISRELMRALERDELELAYQPQYALTDGRLVGFEALLRWTSPKLGLVPPDRFVPVAEETGQIREIGYWVCQRAVTDLATLTADRAAPIRVAVNVSPAQLVDSHFARNILDIAGGRQGRVALELTERVLMHERGRGKRQLMALNEAGLPLVLDDFGTGFSSLNHLRHFPISEVKIDRSFVADIISDRDDAQLVNALIKLCADLNIEATAEGIETEAQLDWLRTAGCALGQGYLLARPLPLAAAAALADRTRTIRPAAVAAVV